jgi:hypothetical protein
MAGKPAAAVVFRKFAKIACIHAFTVLTVPRSEWIINPDNGAGRFHATSVNLNEVRMD